MQRKDKEEPHGGKIQKYKRHKTNDGKEREELPVLRPGIARGAL
jgi:hypothetical protein